MTGRGVICSIYGCFNYRIQSDRKSFYRFPKNKELLENLALSWILSLWCLLCVSTRCALWVAKSRRGDLDEILKTKGSEYLNRGHVVCSDHFTEKDFRNKNLLSQGIWPSATPSLLCYDVEPTDRQCSCKKRKRGQDSDELPTEKPPIERQPKSNFTESFSSCSEMEQAVDIKCELDDFFDEADAKCEAASMEQEGPQSVLIKCEPKTEDDTLLSEILIKEEHPIEIHNTEIKEEDIESWDATETLRTGGHGSPSDGRHFIPSAVEDCSASTEHSSSLNEDLKTSVDSSQFGRTCKICSEAFDTVDRFIDHLLTHSGGKGNLSCDLCPKTYFVKRQLQEHMKTHKNELNYFFCSLCSKTFKTKYGLQQHWTLHRRGSRAYKYKCKYCSMILDTSVHTCCRK